MKKTIKDIDVNGKTVFLRVDFNVPLSDNGEVLDATRIENELPTISYLLKNNAKVIICSHLGRPKGEVVPKLSMIHVAKYLIKCLHCKIHFSSLSLVL